MSWLEKLLPPPLIHNQERARPTVPEGLWVKCPGCKGVLYKADLENSLMVCNNCDYHLLISARSRVNRFLDENGKVEVGDNIRPLDFLEFMDSKKYSERIIAAEENSGETDALVVFSGSVDSQGVVVAVMSFEFMGGSMGSVVGERFRRGVDVAIERRVPFICFAASGGARMQEGLTSLMQMAKVNAALIRLADLKIPFISVLTHPTMGGVSASFAFMGDVVIAEPGASVGFAGQRVIENTVREELPRNFQKAEFLMEKGAIDCIVHRKDIRHTLAALIKILSSNPTHN